jgi:hypothetical protein
MLFVILFNALVTLLLLFLDISLLYHAFPIHYHKWVSKTNKRLNFLQDCAKHHACILSPQRVAVIQHTIISSV